MLCYPRIENELMYDLKMLQTGYVCKYDRTYAQIYDI